MIPDLMAEEERRYDVLPPWAWPRPTTEAERLARKIATIARLLRENDRMMTDSFTRLARAQKRHRERKAELSAQLAAHRTELEKLR
jgi:hypothetical protein